VVVQRKVLIFLWAVTLTGHFSLAQLSQPGQPRGLDPVLRELPFAWEEMPRVDPEVLRAEDELFDGHPAIPWRFGSVITVDFAPGRSGTWHVLEGGQRLWRLGIRSPGALSLNLVFDRYRLPPGAELHVYSPDGSQVLGAFTHHNNQADGYFATTLIYGDALILEYMEPSMVPFPGELRLESVTHGYRDTGGYSKIFGRSGACNINVACSEADGWEGPVDATVRLLVGGNSLCTGTLINNVASDSRPFLLTANHCFANPGTLVAWFNYQSATCENPEEPPLYDVMSGAVSRARSTQTDMWLVELNQRIPNDFNPHYAGWNRVLAPRLDETVAGVHHPRGDIKKFSYSLNGADEAAYLGAPGSGTNYWRVTWSGGTTTEPGSSGSALFDSEGRIIGQLFGGYAACGNTLPDWYGQFGVSWTGGGEPHNSLSHWLDPEGTEPEAIGGYRPFFTVTVDREGLGVVEPPPGLYNIAPGETFSLSARGGARWRFTHWDMDGLPVYDPELSFAVEGDMRVTAAFEFSRTSQFEDPDPEEAYQLSIKGGASFVEVLVEGTEGIVLLELFAAGGQILRVREAEAGGPAPVATRFDVSGLGAGIYLVRVTGPAGSVTEKIHLSGATRP
jgi:hypothetical protein